MRFCLFLAIAMVAYMVDLPRLVLHYAGFYGTIGLLVLLMWWLAFAPTPSDRRWN